MIISIIVPTRERADYLKESIQTVLQIPDPNIEIIINDNANTDGTKQVISEISDPRIKHIDTGRRVSMRENFEFGLRNSTGDYVTFLGDDDGILPRQFKFLRHILEKERPDTLGWNVPSTFIWPEEKHDKKSGSVIFNKEKSFGGIHRFNGEKYGKHLLACHLSRIRFPPGIYAAGCASRGYLKRIAAPDGTYFNSIIPDAYFWFRALLEGGNFLHVDHPFAISGQSPTSGGKTYHALPDKSDDSKTMPYHRFMAESQLDNVTDVVPHTLSNTLIPFATLETIRARFPREDQVPDYLAWYNYVLSEDSSWRSTVEKILREYAVSSGTLSEFEQAEAEQASKRTRKTEKCCATSQKALSELKEVLRNYATRSPIFPVPKKFRLSAEIARKNTILTAVNVYDSVLADDYEHILNRTVSRKAIWKRAVKRSRAYRIWQANT
uniref:Glycosyltransferase involved in cell wall bisynthesis n=1 Tax=Candidatus Kentrum sp. FW TaxID=2126338 RepID=A0A450SUN1_9GAMM|nr:MAG: Glycosyltransferase involved in cell wall bisynthesis [Candidatus Kentron sp. FW]